MTLPLEIIQAVRSFRSGSDFDARGGVVTDLDGTALHEREGRLYVAETVTQALKALADLGRPVVINTLRFPLNVMRSFGREWSAITGQPVPLVSLNGAVLGLLVPEDGDWARFEEMAAFPLSPPEIQAALTRIEDLIADGLSDLVVFIYPRASEAGEIVWTPDHGRTEALRAKFASASAVIAGPLEGLGRRLLSQDICMLSIQIDIPEDRRMAYQHVSPSQFVTTAGVDKLSGAREAAARLDFDLQNSVGAGDTPMDRFLEGVGLGLHVGPLDLAFRARSRTLRLDTPRELGLALFELARLESQAP